MGNTVVLGDFEKIPDIVPAESSASMVFHPIDLLTHWKRCGILADFIASFYSFTSPGKQDDRVLYNLSTVINELIENAAKFSRPRSQVGMNLRHYSNLLLIEVTNEVHAQHSENFRKFASNLLEADIEELYFRKLEEKQESDTQSGIGLMMILKDYPVTLAFRFQSIDDNFTKITVRAHISTEGV